MNRRGNASAAVVSGALAVIAALFAAGCTSHDAGDGQAARVTVRFGMLPYGDHTYAIIGVKKGWFQEAGINLDYRPVKVDDTVPFLKNGSLDVGSCSPGIIVAAFPSNPGVVNFVFGDVFQGYAIMAQPAGGYKSVTEFAQSGMTMPDAIRAAARQLKGKVFAYPTEAAIKPFIDLVLQKGGIGRNNFKSLVLDDPLTVNAMRNHQADFQVGGVPSHLVLEREGFKPIITSNDLAAAARPSPDSEELASVFTDGWACTRDYYNKNRPTVLRMAGVNFRIMKLIREQPDEALAIHMPYLSSVTGQSFTPAEGRVIYNSLDPFFTFEQQYDWYHNPNSSYYYKNLNGAIINSFVKQGIFKNSKPPSVADVNVADEVYTTLENLKSKTEGALKQFQALANAPAAATQQADQARRFYDAYNYYDSERLASAALRTAGK